MNLSPLQWKLRVLTSGPPGKTLHVGFECLHSELSVFTVTSFRVYIIFKIFPFEGYKFISFLFILKVRDNVKIFHKLCFLFYYVDIIHLLGWRREVGMSLFVDCWSIISRLLIL